LAEVGTALSLRGGESGEARQGDQQPNSGINLAAASRECSWDLFGVDRAEAYHATRPHPPVTATAALAGGETRPHPCNSHRPDPQIRTQSCLRQACRLLELWNKVTSPFDPWPPGFCNSATTQEIIEGVILGPLNRAQRRRLGAVLSKQGEQAAGNCKGGGITAAGGCTRNRVPRNYRRGKEAAGCGKIKCQVGASGFGMGKTSDPRTKMALTESWPGSSLNWPGAWRC